MEKEKVLKVSEFNKLIDNHLKNLGKVIVEGEISELGISSGRWIYITIKDEKSQVQVYGTTYKTKNHDLVEEGMKIHVYGAPSLYSKRGKFQIDAERLEPVGEGALKIALEKLKLKLQKEGLFEEERKRETPVFPEKIGLITAKGSKAYSDFIKVLKHRMGGIKIYFYTVKVQGKRSVETITNAFDYFNKHQPDLDLIVLTRGGGSLEDLKSFNDESIARAVFSSKSPVVCGIGHEKDITIADRVADKRASTPSNAAEMIVRDRSEVNKEVDHYVNNIEKELAKLISSQKQKIVNQINILRRAVDKQVSGLKEAISRFNTRFLMFDKEITNLKEKVVVTSHRLFKSVDHWLDKHEDKLDAQTRLLKSLDVKKTLQRGFSITFDNKGNPIKSTEQVSEDQQISTRLIDGKISSKVFNIDQE